VLILKIPEDTFWGSSLPFIEKIADNKTAYDAWLAYAMRKEAERHGKK